MVQKRVAGVSKTALSLVKTVAYLFFPGPPETTRGHLFGFGYPLDATQSLKYLIKDCCLIKIF